MSPAPSSPGLAQTFALILDGLCRAAAARMAAHRATAPLLLLVWNRLNRLGQRFAALTARVQAGKLPPPRPPKPGPRPPRTSDRAPAARCPQGFAWLIPLLPGSACYGSQLQHLLADPEMQALLRAAPQAGRLLRPLCRMLAVPVPPGLQRPPRPPPGPHPQARETPPRRVARSPSGAQQRPGRARAGHCLAALARPLDARTDASAETGLTGSCHRTAFALQYRN